MATEKKTTAKKRTSVAKQPDSNGKIPGGVTGKGFMPGQSGNPGGRPKKGSAIADILNEIGSETVELNGQTITKREAVLRKVYAEAVKGNNWAVQFIADRTEGKAIDRIIQQEVKDEIIIE